VLTYWRLTGEGLERNWRIGEELGLVVCALETD
jgi:hypothetical protein